LNSKNNNLSRRNLYLIGFMGTGKTVVGEMTAMKLGLRFVDSDQEIARSEGREISVIFEQSGEKRFREMERKFIVDGHPSRGCLVSCGGGLPVAEGMLELLKQRGMVITLWASPETICQRTKENSTRPLLQVEDPLAEITNLLESREATYLAADQVISTEMRSAKAVSELVARAYEENQSTGEN
jgi:shikimate kinase